MSDKRRLDIIRDGYILFEKIYEVMDKLSAIDDEYYDFINFYEEVYRVMDNMKEGDHDE